MKIIANIGYNWWTRGDKGARAAQLVVAAKEAGAHGVCMPHFEAAKVHRVESVLKNFAKFDTPDGLILDIKSMADDFGLEFYVAPSHADAVPYLCSIGVDKFHVENGNTLYLPLLDALVNQQKVLLSTGFATFPEIDEAINALGDHEKIILLHSTGALPTPAKEAQLTRILDLQQEFFPVYVGLESFLNDRLLDFVSMAFRPEIIMRRIDLADKQGIETGYSLQPQELSTLVHIAEAMDEVNEPDFFYEEFVEGDWEARMNKMRCEETGYMLPPER